MAPQYSHRNAIAAIAIGIAVTLVSGVMSDNTSCSGALLLSYPKKKISFVFAQNFSEVSNLTNTFPINTKLLIVCQKQRLYQFRISLTPDSIFRKCTGNGWLDEGNTNSEPPQCVKREPHCPSPPASGDPNILIQIDGQNINIDQNNISLNYSVGTTAIYKCKNPPKSDSQKWSCKKNETGYIWEKNNKTATDLVCEDGNGKSSTTITVSFPTGISTTLIAPAASKPTHESHMNDNKQASSDPGSSSLLRDLLIGICSSLGFVMIAVLFGILYKNRTRLGKRYNNTANLTRQSPFTSMPEGENKSKGKFANGEENLVYANIIPIKVNQETIYAEVETGKIGKSRPTNIKLTIDDDQLHTTYAEIRHSVIPEDQRR